MATLQHSFKSGVQLGQFTVEVSGDETATLEEVDYSETDNGDGTYTYTSQYTTSLDEGEYTFTLTSAQTPEGQTAAWGGQSDTYVLSNTNVPGKVVALYEFEDDSNTSVAVDSVGSYDADIVDATYSQTASVGNLSLSHNGSSSYTQSQTSVDLVGGGSSDAMSIMAWGNMDTTGTGGMLVGAWLDNNYQFYIYESGGVWRAYLEVAGNSQDVSGSSVTTGTYQHVYAEVTQSDFAIYVDGVEETRDAHNVDITGLAPCDIRTGLSPSFNNYYSGLVDDAAAAENTLTDSELQDMIDRSQ